MNRFLIPILLALFLIPSVASAQLSTRTMRAIEACFEDTGDTCNISGSDISGGGSSVTASASGVDSAPVSGGDHVVTVAGGGEIHLLGGDVGIGTTGPESLLSILAEQGSSFDASDVSAQESAGSTLKIENKSGVTNSFAQIVFHHSHNLDDAYSRIVSENTGGDNSDLVFVTEGQGTPAERLVIRSNGNVGIGTTSPGGGSEDGTSALSIGNGTEPTGGVAGQISLFSKDSSDGSTNATLGLLLEQSVEAVGTFTASHKIKVWINGTEYWLELDAI